MFKYHPANNNKNNNTHHSPQMIVFRSPVPFYMSVFVCAIARTLNYSLSLSLYLALFTAATAPTRRILTQATIILLFLFYII